MSLERSPYRHRSPEARLALILAPEVVPSGTGSVGSIHADVDAGEAVPAE